MSEPVIAIAATPRDWAGRLHRYVTDHGGARVRATVLHPHEAVSERYDVLVVDDTTSYLTAGLVSELHHLDRRVLGVYDEDDPAGKGELVAAGVDEVIGRSAATERFVETVTALAALTLRDELDELLGLPALDAPPPAEPLAEARGTIIAVGAASGGCGATEVAIALGTARPDGVVVDADLAVPSIAQRLALAPYPNLAAAIDAVEHQHGTLGEALADLPGGASALPGCERRQRADVRPAETAAVVRALARLRAGVVVDVGAGLDVPDLDIGVADASGLGGHASAVVALADAVVGVTVASPVGVARLLDWLADVRAVAPDVPVHVVVNRAPPSAYKRAEVTAEISRTLTPATLVFIPSDPRVEAAAWAGEPVGSGPFVRGLGPLSRAVLGEPVRVPARLGRWRR